MNLKESGVILIIIGMSIFGLGFLLLIDRALIICGNILISIGIILLSKTRLFNLMHIDKLQGTILFLIGFIFILYKFSLFGLILEIVGFTLLLKESIPSFKTILRGLIWGKTLRMINKKQ